MVYSAFGISKLDHFWIGKNPEIGEDLLTGSSPGELSTGRAETAAGGSRLPGAFFARYTQSRSVSGTDFDLPFLLPVRNFRCVWFFACFSGADVGDRASGLMAFLLVLKQNNLFPVPVTYHLTKHFTWLCEIQVAELVHVIIVIVNGFVLEWQDFVVLIYCVKVEF